MNSIDISAHQNCRVLAFSDTYGIDAGNGVARFLHDLRNLTAEHQLPLELVVPARDETASGLIPIRAPSFSVPGYGELKISMPLRHHRKNIERHIKKARPDCIHVSTPGPFGCFGVTLAKRYRLPLVGIYHTDFTSYARAIVAAQLNHLRDDPQQIFGSATSKLLPVLLPLLGQLGTVNPQAMQDVATMAEIVNRNLKALSDDPRTDHYLCSLAEQVAVNLLRKFYSHFDLLIARSQEQQETLAQQLGFAPERIRCLRPGTDIRRFHPRHADRSIWAHYGVPKDAFIVLYVGRITAEKNIGFLHDIWSSIQAQQPARDLRLVMVGHGEEKCVSRFRALNNTHVIGTHRGEELSRIYASADLLVFPSTTETLGQVGLEAAASGLPAIVSDRGGPKMYVQDGNTGWVLRADEPGAWSDRIIGCSNDPSLKAIGARARDHIADNVTLDHTLQSYWELHAEAIRIRKIKLKSLVRSTEKAKYLAHLEGKVPQQGVMVISDFHAGKRCGNPVHRDQKRTATKAMLSLAMDRKLEVVFGGDFGDHGARVSRLEDDFRAFRSIRDELGFGGRPVFVRGNHDYGFTDQRLEQLTGGCRVHDGLVYFQPNANVTVCHGHIFGLAKTLEVIRSSDSVQHLLGQLREDLLDEDLKPAVIAYDIANMIESGLASHGLRGLSTAWEGVYAYRAMLAEQILRLAGDSNQSDEATWKMIAGLVGTHDNVEVAAMLGVACGGWASLFGHTHEPLAKKKRVRLHDGGRRVAQVVGNSGHINRKRPTCAVAEFPDVTVYEFECKSKQLRPLRRASMSESDIHSFIQQSDDNKQLQRSLPETHTSTVVSARPSPGAQSVGADASHDQVPT
ncbi:MAG: glycosyltransferase [Planctomycetota bacterium]